MDDCKKLKTLLESDEAYDIETNGNFMGTRQILAEYLIKNGIGYVANFQSENELLKYQLKTVIAELNEMKRVLHDAPRRAKYKICKF